MKKKIGMILIIVILALGAGGYYINSKKSETTNSQAINPRMIMEVSKGTIRKTIAAEGFLEPIDAEDLSFPSSSGSVKVKKIYVQEGERVKKGQLLMELDDTEARLNLLQKQNSYDRARINGSKNEIEEARINLTLAKDHLENLKLAAPFNGIVTDIYLEEGSYYNNGNAATIKDTSRLQVEVNIEESDIPIVKIGQQVNVTLTSLPGVELNGQVSEMGSEANNSNSIVTLPITVLLDKVDYDVKLGCSADLDIIVGEEKDKVVVPITAIMSNQGRDSVIKVVDGKKQPTAVKTGLSDGLRIAIESGLEPGEKILLNTFGQAQGFNPNQAGSGGFPGAGFMGGGRR